MTEKDNGTYQFHVGFNSPSLPSGFTVWTLYSYKYSTWCQSWWLSWICVRLVIRSFGKILSWRFDHEIFPTFILSLPLIKEGQLSVSGERMCTIQVNRLEDQAYPVNVWLGKLTALDMTPFCWVGRKTLTQTNKLWQIRGASGFSVFRKWTVPTDMVPSSIYLILRFKLFCQFVQFQLGLWSSVGTFAVATVSASGQQRPRSDCADAQSDLGLCCPHVPRRIFSLEAAQILSIKSTFIT